MQCTCSSADPHSQYQQHWGLGTNTFTISAALGTKNMAAGLCAEHEVGRPVTTAACDASVCNEAGELALVLAK